METEEEMEDLIKQVKSAEVQDRKDIYKKLPTQIANEDNMRILNSDFMDKSTSKVLTPDDKQTKGARLNQTLQHFSPRQ